ncbi:cyanase [Paenibacillus abyssi]|uniref:Cyanate hydratase n=1 Tax=Paenibacillus abyssi TaxID=1340531 RepID=A0A917G0Z1_9BACL|nr:cyanase [Paenibacillus abyssi]GGG16939.1 cyanate hydratase [Paenibacillus abyssi]
MDRTNSTLKVLEAKAEKQLSWAAIAEHVGAAEVWVTTALLGQATMSPEQAAKAGEILGLDQEVAVSLTIPPFRGGAIQMPPTEPALYRLYEIIMVYGPAFKEILNEKFGDGIMSAIDYEMSIEKKEDPKGDRVIVTLNGKFLPYRKF